MKCICCNSRDFSFYKEKNNYKTYLCNNCGFIFVYPTPKDDEIYSLYKDKIPKNDELYNEGIRLKKIYEDESIILPKRKWFRWVINQATKLTEKKSLEILEIGSGGGMFIHYANKNGHHAIGTESTEEYAKIVSSTIEGNIIYIDNNDLNKYFKSKKFDLIFMEHSFEHIKYPLKYLNEIKELMDDNSVIILSMPNQHSALSKMLGKRWRWFVPPVHLFYYNIHAINFLFDRIGFEITYYFTKDYFFRSICQFYSFDDINSKIIDICNKIFRKNMKYKRCKYPPTTLLEKLNFLPYYILKPLIESLEKHGAGSELVIIGRRGEHDF